MRSPCLLVTLFLVCLAGSEAAQVPKWFVPCFKDDPKFNECALQHGREAIPMLVQGDRKLRIPVLDPLEVTELKVDKAATKLGIGILLSDVKLMGLGGTQLQDFNVDFEKRNIAFTCLVPRVDMLCTYNVSGQIFLLPITGQGPTNITTQDCLIHYSIEYDLEERSPGKHYMVLKNNNLDFNITRASFRLENLFNGNKFLGENMNAFLNENWVELVNEIGPAIAEALEGAIKQVLVMFTNIIPFEEVFPSRPQ